MGRSRLRALGDLAGLAIGPVFLMLLVLALRLSPQGADLDTVNLTVPVDAFHPVIDLAALGLDASQVGAIGLEAAGSLLPRRFDLAEGKLIIRDDSPEGVLAMHSSYTLTLYDRKGQGHRIRFATAGLPDITSKGGRRVLMVPAMPEKGFHWPYFLVLPSDGRKAANQGVKRYLVVESNNTGPTKNAQEALLTTRDRVERSQIFALGLADHLWAPALVPAFPRPEVSYTHEGKFNAFYTHALDRDTAILHLLMQEPYLAGMLESRFATSGAPAGAHLHLDRQLAAMIDHAVEYLNEYGHQVESQAFLVGYSASGTFVDRFAALHPHKVKAVVSGATLDDMLLPLAEHQGERLIFPIGTADYEAITGRPFDLAAHNQVARLIYMGEDDPNNTLPYTDCYGDEERGIITRLWDEEILPRARALTDLYGQAGGQGIFILDKGIAHSYSKEMLDYTIRFLAENRDSDTPVYPVPTKPEQLKYTLYK